MRLPSLFPSRNAAASAADPASGVWLITFTDLIGLLLAFFIMMYAMSKIDQERWGRLVAQLGTIPGTEDGADLVSPQTTAPTEVPSPARGRDIAYLAALLPQKLSEQPALAQARVVPGANRIDIVLPADTLLKPRSAAPSDAAASVMEAVRSIVANLPNAVRIESRTGGRAQQAQHWTLGAARSAAVAAALAAAGYDRPLEARTYLAADGGPDSIAIVILE
jgi:chemotaxis protein MotB